MKKLVLALAAALTCAVSQAQNTGTGAYAHASFDTPGFDQINLGNLNVRFNIPIFSKAGRGLPFNYTLQYEGLIWQPVYNGNTTSWVPDPNWGFTGLLNGSGVTGYLSYNYRSTRCIGPVKPGQVDDPPMYTVTSNYVYHDAFGAQHAFTYASNSGGCPSGSPPESTTGSTVATDGSGYRPLPDQNAVQTTSGTVITLPVSAASGSSASAALTDANGNTISFNGSGSYTDTTGATALTISGSNPVSFTYPVTQQSGNATTATASLYYKTYKIETQFLCSNIGDFGVNSPYTAALVDHIVLADGETYSFTYEGTPGVSGAYTGRLASVVLPTGGTISYSYRGGCGPGSGSGILPDGSAGPLTRTTSYGARSYDRINFFSTSNSHGNSTVLYDEANNQSEYMFSVDSLGQYIETHRQVFQGAIGQNPALQEVISCYNNVSMTAGTCDQQAVSEPITEADATTTFNGLQPATIKNGYNSTGQLLVSSSVLAGATVLTTTTNTYSSPNAVTELTATTVKDGNTNTIAYTSYGYDETSTTATSSLPQHSAPSSSPGNQTSVHVSIDGTTSNTLNTTTGYYDTGMPASTTDPSGLKLPSPTIRPVPSKT